jgi:hypothetical protein
LESFEASGDEGVRASAIFLGGAFLGALFVAVSCYDLFRSAGNFPGAATLKDRGMAEPAAGQEEKARSLEAEVDRLKDDLAEATAEIGRFKRQGAGGPATGWSVVEGPEEKPAGSTSPPVSPRAPSPEKEAALAHELRESLVQAAWPRAAALGEELLGLGERGEELILLAVAEAVKAGLGRGDLPGAYPILRAAARHEGEVEDLLGAALSSPSMADPEFAALVYRLAPEFAASLGENGPALRAPLVQRLLAALEEEGSRPQLWWVLQGLSTLGVDPDVEPLGRMLLDPAYAAEQGLLVLHVAKAGTPEAALVLAAFIERAVDPGAPAVAMALRELARMQVDPARAALSRFLEAPGRDLREAAHLAYFSRIRGPEDLGILARFLDAEGSGWQKHRLLLLLRERSPKLFGLLRSRPESLGTAEAKALVAREEAPPEVGPEESAPPKPQTPAVKPRSTLTPRRP